MRKGGVRPSLITLARRAFADATKLSKDSTLLVAVSGGPDSMALLHVTAKLARDLEIEVVAHGVDHGLRPEATVELDRAEELADRLGVGWDRTRVHVAKGTNVQARARDARWSALVTAARRVNAPTIATAHHADDRAETVLLRILRGAGARGLAVLPPRAPCAVDGAIDVIRPLLRARRADVMLHIERHMLPFSRDPSNEDKTYLRTRVRHDVLPLLEALDPGIVRHLEGIADDLATIAHRGDDVDDDRAQGRGFALSRKTQEALADLARSRSRTARVWLPSGLVATYEDRGKRGKQRTG